MWRYRNPVEVRFGAGVFDGLGKVLAGRPYCLVTYDDANGGGAFAELTRRATAMAGAPAALVRNIGPNPDFIGLAESCRALCRRRAAGRGDRRARRRLGDGRRQGAGGGLGDFDRVRRFLETGRAPTPRPHADHRRADHRRHRQRGHVLGHGVGHRGQEEILAGARHALSRGRAGRSAADARPAARHHRQHRPRCAEPRAGEPLERQRQPGFDVAGRGRRRARCSRPAAAGRRSRQCGACARAWRAPACSPGSPFPTPGPRLPTRSPIT